MTYTKEEQRKINNWLVSVGAKDYIDKEFFEYKSGQLLEIARAKEDSLRTWDEWQHLQICMGMEIPLEMAIRFTGVLWENDIETLELATESSEEYYKKTREMNLVDMRKIHIEQLNFVTEIAKDIIKHNANKDIIKHAKGYAHLENEYNDFWRINWGEAYVYVDIDKKGNVTGHMWYSNEEMGVEQDGTYEGTLKDLKKMTIEEAYDSSWYSDNYDEYNKKEYKLKYKPM